MPALSRRLWPACLLVAALAALAACGRTAPASDDTGPASGATTTITVSSDRSPVAGLSPDQLRQAVEAPGAAARRAPTPGVDRVTLADGTRLWRVTIPGDFPVRSARAIVSVGGRVVGQAIATPDQAALVAITADATGLVAGATVSYQWEGAAPIAAGRLAVVR